MSFKPNLEIYIWILRSDKSSCVRTLRSLASAEPDVDFPDTAFEVNCNICSDFISGVKT